MTYLTCSCLQAFIIDLVVAPAFQQQGLGTKLLEAIFDHRSLKDVVDFELYCSDDMISYYSRFGFAPPRNGVVFLRKRTREFT